MTWNRATVVLLLSAWIGMTSGCGDGSRGPSTFLRVLDGQEDQPSVDVFIDGVAVSNNLAYLADTGYISVNAGSRHISVTQPGSGTNILMQGSFNLTRGTHTTIVLFGHGPFSSGTLQLTDDTAAGQGAKVRISDAALSSTGIDVYIVNAGAQPSGNPTLTDLSLNADANDMSSYMPFAPGSYDVFFTETGTHTVLYHTGTITLSVGQNRTIVLLDCPADLPPTCDAEMPQAAAILVDLN
jgi:hypothetical protein